MSIKSTHFVTREFAIQAIKRKVYENEQCCKQRIKNLKNGRKLKHISDSELEDILEEAIHNGFYNFSIVDQEDIDENKNQEYSRPYLDNLDYLPCYNDAH